MEKLSEKQKAELIAEIQNDPKFSEEYKDKLICNIASDGRWITMQEYNSLKKDLEYWQGNSSYWREDSSRLCAEIKRLEIRLKAMTAKYNKLAGIEDKKKEPGKIIYMNQ